MALADVRKTVIQIINEVQRKLGLDAATTLTETKQTQVLLDLLNDVMDEISDFGDWPQMYHEVDITAASSVGVYKISVSGDAVVKNVYEFVWGDDVSPLEVRSIEDIRRLQRLASFGAPRQVAIIGASGASPFFRIYPIPNQSAIDAETSAGGVFNIAYYEKPRLFTTADVSALPEFPSRVVTQGLYAKALLEENGGEPTPQYQVSYAEYGRMRIEALNRWTADTGTDVYFVPTGNRYG